MEIKRNEVRAAKIQDLADSSENSSNLNFDKENHECKIIKISHDYLIYRLDNTRTRAKQLEYISNNPGKGKEFFSNDRQDDDDQQNIQHDLLMTFLEGDDYNNMDTAFENAGGQSEPILITKQGVVVNGNRRLAYMRDKGTQTISCMVLPDYLEDKYLEIEAFLDLAIDPKVKYDWVSVGLSLIQMKDSELSEADIAKRKSMTTHEVKKTIKAVELAIEDLKKRNLENKFSELNKTEQLFMDAADKLIKKNSKNPLDNYAIETALSLVIASSKEANQGRKYDTFKPMLKSPEIITKVLSDKFPKNKSDESNPFGDDDNNITSKEVDTKKVEKFLGEKNQDDLDELVIKIKQDIADKKSITSEEFAKKEFLKFTKRSRDSLYSALENFREDSDKKNIDDIISQIEDYIKQIKDKL